ncbi:MAG TPA: hypothetical protein VIL68_13545 [Propionibacteriaceae bacterium]
MRVVCLAAAVVVASYAPADPQHRAGVVVTSFVTTPSPLAHYQRLARDAVTTTEALMASAHVDPAWALAEAGDVYLASLRFDERKVARARFDAVVDEVLAATDGDPAAVRALVRMLAFDLAQARSAAGIVRRLP